MRKREQLELLDKLREELRQVPQEGFYVREPGSGEYRPFGSREWEALGVTPEYRVGLPDE